MTDILKQTDSHSNPSFTLRNRLKRAVWGAVCALLFRPSPRPLHAWRAAVLRAFGARLGKNCHVYPHARIWAPWNLNMDDESCLADDVICYSMGEISIGKRTVISQGAHLCAGTHDYEDPAFQLIAAPIRVGERVWICADGFVGPGVTIGDGAVVGARSVVVRDMPAWMVCAGNPCRPLKKRTIRGETLP